MTSLVDKIVACHQALSKAGISHAFGGALALAWCTKSARGTIDIDINIFVTVERSDEVLSVLSEHVRATSGARKVLKRESQVRLWWDSTPVDLFLNNTAFHEEASQRVVIEKLSGVMMLFLNCSDLAVFKAFYNRTKDWADLEAMQEAGTLDLDHVMDVIREYLGNDDERMQRLGALPVDRSITTSI